MKLITKPLKEIITTLLTERPYLRDNDEMLTLNVWYMYYIRTNCITKDHFSQLSVLEILKQVNKGQLPKTESIRRTRQKVQEKNSHLRGKIYNSRQSAGEEIRTTIHGL